MKPVSVYLSSQDGDQYHISLSPVDERLLSDRIKDELRGNAILVDIDLVRVKGNHFTSRKILAEIERVIANTFFENRDIIICFYCDFISGIPATKKRMSPQAYRSLLFRKMFDRYVQHNNIRDVHNIILNIDGIEETNFIHLIVRSEHMRYVPVINEELTKDYGK